MYTTTTTTTTVAAAAVTGTVAAPATAAAATAAATTVAVPAANCSSVASFNSSRPIGFVCIVCAAAKFVDVSFDEAMT